MKKILVIAPHLDDEALGCGGTIAKLVSQGHEVHVCFVAHRVYGHKYDAGKMDVELAHAQEAKQILGYQCFHFLDLPDERLDACVQDIIIPLEAVVEKLRPEIVYSPFRNDNNQDHQAVAKATQVVLRPAATGFLKRWLMYETPSSTEQAPSVGTAPFAPNAYTDITEFMDRKLDAVNAYETESRSYPHPRSPEALRALCMKRGVEVVFHFAEAFMVVRDKD